MFDASPDLKIYYQSSLFGEDVAYVQNGTRVLAVPYWLWAEWELPGGIQGIVDTWQGGLLKRYWPPGVIRLIEMGVAAPDVEEEVFSRVRIMGRALRRFMAGRYRDTLNSIEVEALGLEMQYVFEHAPLATKATKYEWISKRMSRGSERYTALQIRDILEGASILLRSLYEAELIEKMGKTLRAIREIKIEAAAEAAQKAA